MDSEQARTALTRKLAELEALSADSAQSREAVHLDQQSVGRLSRMDALQQQAMAQATETRRRQALGRVRAALRRLDEGEYGYCTDCGDDIAHRRLAHDPAAERCLACADRHEQH